MNPIKRVLPTSSTELHRRFNLHPEFRHHLKLLWHHQIFDPDSDLVAHWNHIFLIVCVCALFIDPLYFFLPLVGDKACLSMDIDLSVKVTFLRSVADLFYLFHMIMKFRTAYVAPSSRVFGRGDLVTDSGQIAIRYLKTDFVIDLAAALPLPQIIIWLIIMPANRGTNHTNSTLALIVLLQYIPRLFLIFPLNARIIKTTGLIAKTAWAGAAYNLVLYMLASHVLGASWYLLCVGRQHTCWKDVCSAEGDKIPPCQLRYLNCRSLELDGNDREYWKNVTEVIKKCDANDDDIHFKFGIYADAFTNDVATAPFVEKYLYCLWWGLRNLSSYGQNLETSTFLGETTFCCLISIAGLVLFAQLIGNMQTYLQSMTVRLEEWRVKRRDTEEWMRHRQLPPELQDRVHRFVQYKWVATRGVDEETILQTLPVDLRREIQRHLCLALVLRVPFFSQIMDDQLLDAICERLVSSLSTQGTYIFREGDPVNEMLFIIRGELESNTTDGGRSGFFNSITLGPGDFCGEELLTWALMPHSSLNLPSSTRTVKALTEVEAFALCAEDLKYVSSQFKRLHSKTLQHAFRYYSHQWRTWGSCIIQAAWRRHRKREMLKKLGFPRHDSIDYLPGPEEEGDYGSDEESSTDNRKSVYSFGTTLLASKFAANTKRGIQMKAQFVEPASSSLKMPKLFKPDEPDFSREEDV